MNYNTNFLVAAMIILLLTCFHFFSKHRPTDLNNQFFIFLMAIASLDVAFEMMSTFFIINSEKAIISTTIFYLFQAILPYVLIWYIGTLRSDKILSFKNMIISGIPTIILIGIILTNPYTKLLFYFDESNTYLHGPLYMLMYYSAGFHVFVGIILVILWRKILGLRRILVLIELSIIVTFGISFQYFNSEVLTTGFGLSLAVLALFIAINNPYVNTDSLTGLYDKTYLEKKIYSLMNKNLPFHVITLNIYNLSHINSVFGGDSGDALLRDIADKLQNVCGVKVFRISGRHFLIIAESLKEYETDLNALKEIFSSATPVQSSNVQIPAIASGILEANKLKTQSNIIEYSEYLESLSTKPANTIDIIEGNDTTLDRFYYTQKVEKYLLHAIDKDLFEVFYQPVYSLKEDKYISLEALSRLRHPELGWISPDLFIQLAEKNKAIEKITDLQFHKVCKFIKDNPELMTHLKTVKMNLSPIDLMRNDCSEHFISIIDEYQIPHSFIQFEITETVATEYNTSLTNAINGFQKEGIGLCLDDFGSGYANFNTVTQIPFSIIKLDRSLLFNVKNDSKAAAFYQSIVSVFHSMGYSIVSEGVETQEENDLLNSWGVDMIQGYFYSKPLSKDKLLKLILK